MIHLVRAILTSILPSVKNLYTSSETFEMAIVRADVNSRQGGVGGSLFHGRGANNDSRALRQPLRFSKWRESTKGECGKYLSNLRIDDGSMSASSCIRPLYPFPLVYRFDISASTWLCVCVAMCASVCAIYLRNVVITAALGSRAR